MTVDLLLVGERLRRIEDKINLQRDDGKAMPYQVKQVRAVILKYKPGGEL